MFQLPIVKHNYAWAGCMPAGARSTSKLLLVRLQGCSFASSHVFMHLLQA